MESRYTNELNLNYLSEDYSNLFDDLDMMHRFNYNYNSNINHKSSSSLDYEQLISSSSENVEVVFDALSLPILEGILLSAASKFGIKRYVHELYSDNLSLISQREIRDLVITETDYFLKIKREKEMFKNKRVTQYQYEEFQKYHWIEKMERGDDLFELTTNFTNTASKVAKILILEKNLPFYLKSIKPSSVGGVAGGEKFIAHGILYKYAVDTYINPPGYWIYGQSKPNNYLASKALNNDVKALRAMHQCKRDRNIDITLPLLTSINYLGITVAAISLFPIENSNFVYGTYDGGKTIFDGINNHVLLSMVNEIADYFGFEEHVVLDQRKVPHSIVLAADVEIHEVNGTYYMLDFGRFLPPNNPQSPFVEQFRPEYLRLKDVKLSCDIFSGFGRIDKRNHNKKGIEQIELFYSYIANDVLNNISEATKLENLKHTLHELGVNLRYIGTLRKTARENNIIYNTGDSDDGNLYVKKNRKSNKRRSNKKQEGHLSKPKRKSKKNSKRSSELTPDKKRKKLRKTLDENNPDEENYIEILLLQEMILRSLKTILQLSLAFQVNHNDEPVDYSYKNIAVEFFETIRNKKNADAYRQVWSYNEGDMSVKKMILNKFGPYALSQDELGPGRSLLDSMTLEQFSEMEMKIPEYCQFTGGTAIMNTELLLRTKDFLEENVLESKVNYLIDHEEMMLFDDFWECRDIIRFKTSTALKYFEVCCFHNWRESDNVKELFDFIFDNMVILSNTFYVFRKETFLVLESYIMHHTKHTFSEKFLNLAKTLFNDMLSLFFEYQQFQMFEVVENIERLNILEHMSKNDFISVIVHKSGRHHIGAMLELILNFFDKKDLFLNKEANNGVLIFTDFLETILRLKTLQNELVSVVAETDSKNDIFKLILQFFDQKNISQLQKVVEKKMRKLEKSNLLQLIKTIESIKILHFEFSPTVKDYALEFLSHLDLGMTNLSLSLSHCEYITSEGIQFVSNISNVTKLDLFYCTGIKDQGMKYLSQMESLTDLNLSYSEITVRGTLLLSQNTNIISLKLSFCQNFTNESLLYISAMKRLSYLDLSHNLMLSDAGIEHLSTLANLNTLLLDNCDHITELGIASIGKMVNLTYLSLSNCNGISDDAVFSLRELYYLRVLNLSLCRNITDAGLEFVAELKNVLDLNLYYCSKITDGGCYHLAHLVNLTALDISQCTEITDEGLDHISNLEKLKTINLNFCYQITPERISQLKLQIPGLNHNESIRVLNEYEPIQRPIRSKKRLKHSGRPIKVVVLSDDSDDDPLIIKEIETRPRSKTISSEIPPWRF